MELDVRLSKNGVPMVFHDSTLRRMCKQSGRLGQYTQEDLALFRVNERLSIPTLEQALKWADLHQVGLYVELKDHGNRVLDAVLPLLENHASPLMVSCFHHATLWECRRRAPGLPLMALCETPWLRPWRSWKATKVQEVGVSLRLAQTGVLEELVGRGWPVLVFTVNDERVANALRERGASGVFSDHAR